MAVPRLEKTLVNRSCDRGDRTTEKNAPRQWVSASCPAPTTCCFPRALLSSCLAWQKRAPSPASQPRAESRSAGGRQPRCLDCSGARTQLRSQPLCVRLCTQWGPSLPPASPKQSYEGGGTKGDQVPQTRNRKEWGGKISLATQICSVPKHGWFTKPESPSRSFGARTVQEALPCIPSAAPVVSCMATRWQ